MTRKSVAACRHHGGKGTKSFWSSTKQFFGFTGVSVQLEWPPQISKSQRRVAGQLTIKSSAAPRIKRITKKLEEEWTTGRGEEKTEKTFTLGQLELEQAFELGAGESRVVPFDFPSSGTASKWSRGERSKYREIGEVDVEGTPYDPGDRCQMELSP